MQNIPMLGCRHLSKNTVFIVDAFFLDFRLLQKSICRTIILVVSSFYVGLTKVLAIALGVALLSAPLSSTELPQSQSPIQSNSSRLMPFIRLSELEAATELQARVSVPEIARQVTVRILGDPALGSGVIIDRQGQTYTVLTSNHVVEDNETGDYTVLTADGRTHQGRWLRSSQFVNVDLALVEFSSRESYRVAEIADSTTLVLGDRIYAAGFPNWHFEPGLAEETRDWGLRAYRLTQGTVELLPTKALQDGYQIGYTNDIAVGMSGGPLLNKNGRLVGINGRHKYPLLGADAFLFADGTRPSEALAEEMVPLSWAIPIASLQPVSPLLGVERKPNRFDETTERSPFESLEQPGSSETDNERNPFEDLFE